jgi:hypothetical protein
MIAGTCDDAVVAVHHRHDPVRGKIAAGQDLANALRDQSDVEHISRLALDVRGTSTST